MKRMRPASSAAPQSRTRGWRTPTGPMPVMTSRSGRCPWRTTRPKSARFGGSLPATDGFAASISVAATICDCPSPPKGRPYPRETARARANLDQRPSDIRNMELNLIINRYIVAILCIITSIVVYEPDARAQQGANNPWRMAYAAQRAQNYAEAMRWFQQIYLQGAGSVGPYDALGDRAMAAEQIGDLYADGLGVPRDYSMAAQWYQRSTAVGQTLPGNGSRARLGILYAWGLGVPQNRAIARQLFAQISGNAGQSYIDLLDNNLLPRSFAEVRDAMGRLAALKRQQQARRDAQEAAREAAAEREARLHPSTPLARSTSQGSTSQGCSLTDAFVTGPWMFSHGGGMITGMWAGNGCH